MKKSVALIACALSLLLTNGSNAFAACGTQVGIAALNYVVNTVNDNEAGAPMVHKLFEVIAGQDDIRNGVSEVSVIYHKKNITSVHDLEEIKLNVVYQSPTCRILGVKPK